MATSIIPLAMVFPDKKVRIVFLNAGRRLEAHLLDMGLKVGSEIEVIKQGSPGPCLVAVKETRIAIGYGMAQKIMVSMDGTERDKN
ncbi:MAG: ferrous iron transport protein A [Candidatus Omnitrophica bacterium]|nr:ferrous iron transport protein A [Candidatus Omnitrophota bacterium]